jgi:hypothetical protein
MKRLAGGWCTVCQRWSRFVAQEDGHAHEGTARLRISKGEPICPYHKLVDDRGLPMLITMEELVVA